MAIYHCHQSQPKTPATQRQAYLERLGKQAYREDKVFSESANLPSWAKNANDFWDACQQYEPGVQYTEIEFSLPNEVDEVAAIEMARAICREELGGHAYTMAIHENVGRISGVSNRHCHVMYTEREIDIKRQEPDRVNYFKKSRTRKDGTISGGYKKSWKMTKDRSHAWYRGFRKHVEIAINQELERLGIAERVSCESYKKQGKTVTPQIHVGAKDVKIRGERYRLNEEIKANRVANAELRRDRIALRNAAIKAKDEKLVQTLNEQLKEMDDVAEMLVEKQILQDDEVKKAEKAARLEAGQLKQVQGLRRNSNRRHENRR